MSDPTVSDLIELPRRVVKQPTPELNPGGDCGACVLAGLTGLSIEDVYAKLHPKKSPQSFSTHDMADALRAARWEIGAFDRVVYRTPHWPQDEMMRAWGDTSWTQSLDWEAWLRMAFDAGYYAIATVRHTPEPGVFMTNHWVLYAGLRTKWDKPRGEAPNTGHYQILVSDSGRTKPLEEWFDISEHLKGRGGFACMLARPVAR